MIKKLNQYLLTHYPLLWNTKVVWVIITNIILHLFFLLAGFAAVDVARLQYYYSFSSPGGSSLPIFSVLCSMAVLIFWLIFYLRNNAFKNFYQVDKYHLIKESIIVLFIIFTSITYFESYSVGVKLKTRTITSQEELVSEANIINLAKAFIPQSKADYFILNTQKNRDGEYSEVYNDNTDYSDTVNNSITDTNYIKIRAALKLPDAFSYSNYHITSVSLPLYKNFIDYPAWYNIKNKWIKEESKDSVKAVLDKFIAICKKYKIDERLDVNELTSLVFASPYHTVTKIFPTAEDEDGKYNAYFLRMYGLTQALEFIDKAYLDNLGYSHDTFLFDGFIYEFYIALCLSLILLCYRWYNKKVFLISNIAAIVWAIIFAIIGSATRSGETAGYLYLILFSLFILLAILNLKTKSSKTTVGVLLTWHIYMLPFVVMIIVSLINSYYYDNIDHFAGLDDQDAIMHKNFPFSYWVHDHTSEIFIANLIVAFLYVIFYFSNLSKKWHIMPEE